MACLAQPKLYTDSDATSGLCLKDRGVPWTAPGSRQDKLKVSFDGPWHQAAVSSLTHRYSRHMQQ